MTHHIIPSIENDPMHKATSDALDQIAIDAITQGFGVALHNLDGTITRIDPDVFRGSQIEPSQALPHKTYDQHQESKHVEIHKGCVDGIPVSAEEPAVGGNGRSVAGRAMVAPSVDADGRCRAQGGATSDIDDVIEELGLKHIAQGSARMWPRHSYRGTDQFERLKAFATELLGTRLAATTQASTAQAELKVWSASEALLYAARVVELYDDATMQGDYMIDSKDCAAILTAMASMPMLAATSSTDAQAAAEVRDAALDAAIIAADDAYLSAQCSIERGEFNQPHRQTREAIENAIRALRAGDTGEQADGGAADE